MSHPFRPDAKNEIDKEREKIAKKRTRATEKNEANFINLIAKMTQLQQNKKYSLAIYFRRNSGSTTDFH